MKEDKNVFTTTPETKTITTSDFSKEILLLREYTCLPFTEVKDTDGFISAELVTLELLEKILYSAFISDDEDNHPGEAIRNCIQKTRVKEQAADGKEFSYTIPQINARRSSSSEPKKNGDFMDELEKQLADIPKLRVGIYADALVEGREDFKEFKQYIENFILLSKPEQFAKSNNLNREVKRYVQGSLGWLLLFPGATDDQKLQAQQLLEEFLGFMENFYVDLQY